MKFTTAQIAVPLLASTAQAMFGNKEPPKPTPNLVDGFAWKDPFASAEIASFESTCEASHVFQALEYTLHDLMKKPPEGLWTWATGLKKFFADRQYPGGWSGYDRHLHDRGILLMDYDQVPLDLRLWIEEEDRNGGNGKGLFAVFDKPKVEGDTFDSVVKFPEVNEVDRSTDAEKVVLFAPGAIYHVLPLWVADGSQCRDDLLDLDRYKPEPQDGAVVGWPEHKRPLDNKMEFKVTVKSLKGKDRSASPEAKKEL